MGYRKFLLFMLTYIVFIQCKAFANNPNFKFNQTEKDSISIQDLSWLTGHWAGEGMGGYNEEIWTSPVDNKMVGVYRHIKDDRIVFYELLTIMRDHDGRPVLKLKHFNPDLTGWEEKDEVVEFKLLRMEPNLVEFDGLSIQLIAKDTLLMNVKFQQKSGDTRTETFRLYKKTE